MLSPRKRFLAVETAAQLEPCSLHFAFCFFRTEFISNIDEPSSHRAADVEGDLARYNLAY